MKMRQTLPRGSLQQSILKLTQHPNVGKPQKFKNPRLQGLRHWPVKGFEIMGIYYLLTENILRVIRVLHGKRDIERILDK
jgi:toxin ParE1/3/4